MFYISFQKYIFTKNRFFSHQYTLIQFSLLPLLPALLPHLHSLQIHSLSTSFSEKRQETTVKQEKKTRYNKTQLKPSYQGWTNQPNRRKIVPRVVESPRNTRSHCKESHKNTKLTSITRIHRTWCEAMLSLCLHSVPAESCLADFMGHVLLVLSIPSDSYNLSIPFPMGFPDLGGEGPSGDL